MVIQKDVGNGITEDAKFNKNENKKDTFHIKGIKILGLMMKKKGLENLTVTVYIQGKRDTGKPCIT